MRTLTKLNTLYPVKIESEIGLPQTRFDNLASSAAASFAFLAANSLLSTASELHYQKKKGTRFPFMFSTYGTSQ